MWDSPNTSLLESFEKWRGWADPKVACDYALSVGITWWNEKVADEMEVLVSTKGIAQCLAVTAHCLIVIKMALQL